MANKLVSVDDANFQLPAVVKVTDSNLPERLGAAALSATIASAGIINPRRMSNPLANAVADGTSHPISERFATLADAQAVFPHATALTDDIDWCSVQSALDLAKATGRAIDPSGGRYYLPRSVQCSSAFGGRFVLRGAGTFLLPLDRVVVGTDLHFLVEGFGLVDIDGPTFDGVQMAAEENNNHNALRILACKKIKVNGHFQNTTNLCLQTSSSANLSTAGDVTTEQVIVKHCTFNNVGQITLSPTGARQVNFSDNHLKDVKLSPKFGANPISDGNLPRNVVYKANIVEFSDGFAVWPLKDYHYVCDIRGPWKNVIVGGNIFDVSRFPAGHVMHGIALFPDERATSGQHYPSVVDVTDNLFIGFTSANSRIVNGSPEVQHFTFTRNQIDGCFDGVSMVEVPSASRNVAKTFTVVGNEWRNVQRHAVFLLASNAGTHRCNVSRNDIDMAASLAAGSYSINVDAGAGSAGWDEITTDENRIAGCVLGVRVNSVNASGTTPILKKFRAQRNNIKCLDKAATSNIGIAALGYGADERSITDNTIENAYRPVYVVNSMAAGAVVDGSRNKYINCTRGWESTNLGGQRIHLLDQIAIGTPTPKIVAAADTVVVGTTGSNVVIESATAPTTGTWAVGDRTTTPTPTAGGYLGYVCTAAGTPGTWKGYGAIAA